MFLGPKNLGSYPCLSCIQCNSMIKGKFFTHPHKGFNIPIRGHYTCQSSFVVYAIKCPCGLVYIGETTQKVKDRIARHKYSIRDKLTQLPLARHFVEFGHSVSQLKYMVLEGIERNRRGGSWINPQKKRGTLDQFFEYNCPTRFKRGFRSLFVYLIGYWFCVVTEQIFTSIYWRYISFYAYIYLSDLKIGWIAGWQWDIEIIGRAISYFLCLWYKISIQ